MLRQQSTCRPVWKEGGLLRIVAMVWPSSTCSKKKKKKLLNIVINKNITNSQQRLRLCNELEPTMHASRGQGWGVAWVAVVCGDFKPSETCLDLLSGVHGRNDNLKVARADILWKINKFGAWRNIPWEIFMAVDLSMELVITPKKWPLWG